MANEVERAFNRVFDPLEGFFAFPTRVVRGENEGTTVRGTYRADVSRTDDGFKVVFDVPGFDADELNLNVYPDYITLKAEQEEETDRGTSTRRIARSIGFDESVDTNTVEADLDNGVLTVTVKTSESAQGRKVQIGKPKQDGETAAQ